MTDPIEPEMEEIAPEQPEEPKELKKSRPALTIVIQSWATLIVALIMLIIGLIGGFFLRPIVLPERLLTTELVNPVLPTSAATTPNPDAEQIMHGVIEEAADARPAQPST